MNRKVLFGGLLALLWTAAPAFAQSVPDIRFSEIHYDNAGVDAGEAIEVSGPAGTDVNGWQIVLYNGNGGAMYAPVMPLAGAFPASCGARGVMVFNYPANGIQNGDPDGFALVDAAGNVVEFLSYEGTFTASNGPAAGLLSTDIGVREAGNDAPALSLARNSAGNWSSPAANTFGVCNDAAPAPVIANVAVTPLTAAITVGGTQQFTATAFDTNGQPVSTTFTWTSSVPAVASVNAMGLATGLSAGDTIIRATAPGGISETAALRVNAAPGGGAGLRFNEIHYDNVGVDVGEAIEIEGPAGTSLEGVSVVLYDGTGGNVYSTMTLSGTLPATCGARGVFVINYPANGIQNGSPDGLALVAANGSVIEFLSYEGAFTPNVGPAAGMPSTDILASENSVAIGISLQRDAGDTWAQATSTFGACNDAGGAPGGGNRIMFSGRLVGDVPLPVGFQDQIFATLRNSTNTATIPTTFTFSSETPAIATIDRNGVFTALAPGMAILRATAADGTTGTTTLPTRIGVASATANYMGNAQFGEPNDADPSDDFLVRYPQFTTSYNALRSTPNWVSYVIDATTFGPEDRCDCFSPDPQLPASFPIITTNDYTGAGAIAGFGIDRGHMVRSFDRTSASLDNANTFYFTNIVPQASDLNQGPWSALEIALGNMARFDNQRVFVIAGPAGNRGTVKNEGKIVIPTSTWKIGITLPQGMSSISDIRAAGDLQLIAVNMPNEPGIRNVPFETYRTTVNEVERISGYDFLAALPDTIERLVETDNAPPEVTNQLSIARSGLILNRATGAFTGTVTVTNTGTSALRAPLQMFFDSLPPSVQLLNATGKLDQSAFITMLTSLLPGESVQIPVQFANPQRVPVSYSPAVYSGLF